MAKTTHTRRGTCQVCGAVQAIDNGSNITAKHGYKVAGYGFFAGVCPGAEHVPAELSLDITHKIIAQLEAQAHEHDEEAHDYRTKDGNGQYLLTVTMYTEWDSKAPGGTYASRGAYVERAITDETPAHIVDDAQTKAAAIAEQNARYARSHVSMMRSHIIPRLGQEFHAPKEVVRAERKVAKAKAVEGVRFPTKASRKDALDRLNRTYDKARTELQNLYLALPNDKRTVAKTDVYYGPHDLCNWRAKHTEAALREFPEAASIVERIVELVKQREVIRAVENNNGAAVLYYGAIRAVVQE